MAKQFYRDRLINNIKHALGEARNASKVEHSGMRGRIREIAASDIFSPMLPGGFEIGTGKICDRDGRQSLETDLVIYNRSILPPILYSERDGLFPIEACFYSIEVKSSITAKEVKDAVQKGQRILELRSATEVADYDPGTLVVHKSVLLALCGFGSDLKESGMTEIERYAKYDPNWNTNPILRVICVAGRGYWYFRFDDSRWMFHPATESYDEVIDFVGGICNSLSTNLDTRKGQRLGYYLIRVEER